MHASFIKMIDSEGWSQNTVSMENYLVLPWLNQLKSYFEALYTFLPRQLWKKNKIMPNFSRQCLRLIKTNVTHEQMSYQFYFLFPQTE